jgi:hypothetical protein
MLTMVVYPVKRVTLFLFNLFVSIVSKAYNITVLNVTNVLNKKIQKIILMFNSRKFLLKKYFYTINHKKLGLYYFYFSL